MYSYSFWFLDQKPLLTNFSFKRCIFCFVFCFTWPSPDYQDFFSLPLKVFAKIFGLSIFPLRHSSEHYLVRGYLCWMNHPVALTPPTSPLAAGPALKHPHESFIKPQLYFQQRAGNKGSNISIIFFAGSNRSIVACKILRQRISNITAPP